MIYVVNGFDSRIPPAFLFLIPGFLSEGFLNGTYTHKQQRRILLERLSDLGGGHRRSSTSGRQSSNGALGWAETSWLALADLRIVRNCSLTRVSKI